MFPYIVKQKQEGSKKTIVLRIEFGKIEKIATIVIYFVFFLLLTIRFGYLSLENAAVYFVFIVFLTAVYIFWFLGSYLGEVRIINDSSTGTITVERGIFKLQSYVIKKEERPEFKLIEIGVPFGWPFIKIKKYLLMIASDKTRIRIDPGLWGELRLTKWYRYRLFYYSDFCYLWEFTEKDIGNISSYLGIDISPDKVKYHDLELKEYYQRNPSSVRSGKV
ncbi:MAG: hypothetical protein WC788_09480 [Candidatus Paceibacterota bacterium]|jgi:hypothetical protein